jgi:hypothetical protein
MHIDNSTMKQGANIIVETFRFSDEKNQVSTLMKNRYVMSLCLYAG